MNTKHLIRVIALIGSVGLFATNADAQRPHTVNCDSGDSIQAALDKQVGHSGPITITVSGTCEEDVNISRDDVTINGNNNATVIGTLSFERSSRIIITNITLSGPGFGVHAIGGEITLSNVTVTQNEEWSAIAVSENGSLSIFESNIFSNNGNGVWIGINSSLVIGGNTVINNNQEAGVHADINSSALIWDDTSIQGNGSGILATNHSIVFLENADVSNNISAGIILQHDGGAILRGENTISGNQSGTSGVFCHDTESSYSNIGVAIADPVNCTDFNQ